MSQAMDTGQAPICVCEGQSHWTVDQHNEWAAGYILAARRRYPAGSMPVAVAGRLRGLARDSENPRNSDRAGSIGEPRKLPGQAG